ncbi:hypothetical protein [Pedobacter sp. GR22-6]|uniref:hypothetical protein n=1 Tax=Pedobacter sp. GR22-6 TaxID=3127957 RepID=UPI00307DC317
MKKKLSLLAFSMLPIFLLAGRANAQSASTDPVTVNINLSAEVISIVLGGSPDVTFNYPTAASYTVPQTVPKLGHFTVISNQNYDVTVSGTAPFSNANSATPIPLNVVTVAVDPATANGGAVAPVILSGTAQPVVSGATPTGGATYNVNYSIPDATPLLGRSPLIYSTTVVYTATQL